MVKSTYPQQSSQNLYPTDMDKQHLASQTGLTRNQGEALEADGGGSALLRDASEASTPSSSQVNPFGSELCSVVHPTVSMSRSPSASRSAATLISGRTSSAAGCCRTLLGEDCRSLSLYRRE
ncbi:hypothetical protein BHM03_00063030 [Ensete ventricosum]|nr:hypothetical protein BHM03_00063030 [Ensete ventricosum]